MERDTITILVGVAYSVIFALITRRLTQRRKRYGPAMAATVQDLLIQDRRNAVQIIIEEKAEARDPEDRDGNLPDLTGVGRATPVRKSPMVLSGIAPLTRSHASDTSASIRQEGSARRARGGGEGGR